MVCGIGTVQVSATGAVRAVGSGAHHYIKADKASGLVDLIKRVVTVSTRTVEIVEGLPSLEQTIARLGGGGRYGRAPAPPHTRAHRP